MAMGGVGDAASVVGLLAFAGTLVSQVKTWRSQVKTWRSQWQSLGKILDEVQHELRILKENRKEFQSPDDSNRIATNLKKVEDLLTEIDGNPTHSDILCFKVPARVCDCLRTPIVVQKLEEATKLLDGVKSDICRKATVQVLSQMPTMSTALPALPHNLVGKSRVASIMQFLEKKDDGVEVKAVVIYGVGGLGKTTLLNWVLHEMETVGNMGPLIRAYVQVNSEPDADKIKSFQSSIILQLGGPKLELPSVFQGRTELHQQFNRMKDSGKRVCLAIDNVWTEKDLKELLPINLGQSLPDGSCILITTRNLGVSDEMKRLCKSEEVVSSTAGTHHHVQLGRERRYTVEPHDLGTLSREDARELFQKWACLTADGHKKLVDALVPLCGGFPLALEVLGVHFQKEENRKRWKEFVKRMKSPDGVKPGIMEKDIMPILRCTYEQVPKPAQDAFADITNYFIGWSWKKVSCIVGEEHMEDLRLRCLIKKQSALSSLTRKSIVAAHDLLRTLGQSLRPGKLLRAVAVEVPAQQLVDGIEGLWQTNEVKVVEVDALRKMTSLRVLRLCIDFGLPDQLEHLHYLELDGHNSSVRLAMGGCKRLSFLQLTRFSGDFTDAQFPRSLRRLYLRQCNKLLCLRGSIVRELTELEVLDISQCPAMQGLPEDIGALEQLQKLAVRDAPDLIELQPSSWMEKLVGLEVLILEGCGLNMWKADVQQLQKLELKSTRLEKLRLEGWMPDMLGVCHDAVRELSLKNIMVCSDSDIESLLLPRSGNLNALEVLDLSGCKGLVSLPESNIGRFSSLKRLNLSRCGGLRGLPESIGSCGSLESLYLSRCGGLRGLPESIGSLSSLQGLDLRECALLEGLPESLGELSSLRSLQLTGCKKLETLPESIGQLKMLHFLRVCECETIERLPDSICHAVSLGFFSMNNCRNLAEIPESIGQLCQLQWLNLEGCVRIERLPDGLAGIEVLKYLNVSGTSIRSIPGSNEQGIMISWPSLESLYVNDCKQLLELPEEVGKAVRSVKGCRQLKSCKGMYGLRRLEDVRGCENLRELPPFLLGEFRARALNQSTSHSDLASAYELRSLQLHDYIDSMPATYNHPLSHMKQLFLRLDDWSADSLQVQLNACTDVESLELVGGTPSLVNLVLEALPPTIGLVSLTLKEIANMQEIPASISRFLPHQSDLPGISRYSTHQSETVHQQRPKLRELHVEKCSNLTKLISFELISSLDSLELSGCNNLSSFPGQLCSSISNLTLKGFRSESADTCIAACLKWGLGESCTLEECSATFLQTVLHVETSWHDRTRFLILNKVPDLEELYPLLFQRLASLEALTVYSCGRLRSVSQEVGMLSRLITLNIDECRQLREIPSEIGRLYSLQFLMLSWCTQLRELPSEICKLVALQYLSVEGCINLAGLLPMLHDALPRLEHLNLSWCSKVAEEASLVHLEAVRPGIRVVRESEEAKIRRQRWRSLAKRGMQRNASLVPDHQN